MGAAAQTASSAVAAASKALGADAMTSITYSGTAGYYRYRIAAYSGSGSYTLGFSNP